MSPREKALAHLLPAPTVAGDAKKTGHVVMTPAERVRALSCDGARLSTGLAALDAATHGGVPLGRLVTLVGAPGAGKTMLAIWWAHLWLAADAAVCILAADEPADSIVLRLGQLAGYDRDALERGGEIAGYDTRAAYAAALDGRPLAILDGDADGMTIEAALAQLNAIAGDRPRALVIDSLQTARAESDALADGPRERIGGRVAAAKRVAAGGAVVVLVSEMSRAAYRTGDRTQDISALAAGKESGDIEYGASLLLGLRTPRGESGVIELETAKNRIAGYGRPDLRVVIDHVTGGLREVPVGEDVQTVDPREGRRAAAIEAARVRVVEAVGRHELRSRNQIVSAAGGKRTDVLAAVDAAEVAGQIARIDGVYRVVAGQGGDE